MKLKPLYLAFLAAWLLTACDELAPMPPDNELVEPSAELIDSIVQDLRPSEDPNKLRLRIAVMETDLQSPTWKIDLEAFMADMARQGVKAESLKETLEGLKLLRMNFRPTGERIVSTSDNSEPPRKGLWAISADGDWLRVEEPDERGMPQRYSLKIIEISAQRLIFEDEEGEMRMTLIPA